MSGFYLKVTEEQAQQMIDAGIAQLYSGTPTKFDQYTYFIEDKETGDKYWRVENRYNSGILYDIEGWIIASFPDLPRYTHEFVSQFIPAPELP